MGDRRHNLQLDQRIEVQSTTPVASTGNQIHILRLNTLEKRSAVFRLGGTTGPILERLQFRAMRVRSGTETGLRYAGSLGAGSNDRDGRVVSWMQYSMDPLKAKLLLSTRVAATEFFTAGSTKDEVLAVQGTLTTFTVTSFSYGSSNVIFRDGRVVSWTQYSMDPLKAK